MRVLHLEVFEDREVMKEKNILKEIGVVREKLKAKELEIQAINLGTSPPNTSRIELIDDKIKYPIITQLKVGNTAIIKIVK